MYFFVLASLDLPNPSTIPESGWVDNMKLWPALQEHHITYYLLKTKACDLEQVQALKSLESYNYVVSGKVGQLLIHQYSEHACIIKGDVTPSQSENNAPHKPWVCIGTDCRVLTGACSCMVGKTRVCSHVGKLRDS